MDKYIEKNGNGYILTEFTEVGHIGNEYPCPQPHPFKDGEDCTGRYRIETREGWPGFSQEVAVPIQPTEAKEHICQPNESARKRAELDYWKRRCLAAEKFIWRPFVRKYKEQWQEIKSQEPKQ